MPLPEALERYRELTLKLTEGALTEGNEARELFPDVAKREQDDRRRRVISASEEIAPILRKIGPVWLDIPLDPEYGFAVFAMDEEDGMVGVDYIESVCELTASWPDAKNARLANAYAVEHLDRKAGDR